MDEIVTYISDVSKVKNYDEMLMNVDTIESFGDYRIFYMRFKG